MQTMEEIKQLISANMEMAGADLAQFGADTPIFGGTGFWVRQFRSGGTVYATAKKIRHHHRKHAARPRGI